MSDGGTNGLEPCAQYRDSDAPTYRQVHPTDFAKDRTVGLSAFTSRSDRKYRLSLACAMAVNSPEHATELHHAEGLESVGCVAVMPVDAEIAVEVAEAEGWSGAELPFIDDSACEGVPDHHLYLDYGRNSKGAR